MTALERIEKLKTARRAELVDAERKRQEAAEVARQEAEQRFNADLDRALKHLDAAWLAEFRTEDARREWDDDDWGRCCRVAFAVPGHRKVWLMLHWYPGGNVVGGDRWLLVPDPLVWMGTDDRRREDSFESLADALIYSEGDPAQPIPL